MKGGTRCRNDVALEPAHPRAVCEAARGRASSTVLASSAFFSTRWAFANQNAPINVLPFEGSL
jgi:hypothetical protein